MQAADTPDSQALFIRPAARLIGGHRYAVAITNRVQARRRRRPAGARRASRRCSTSTHTDHELLEAMRPRFADVLDALENAGIAEDDLVVAWDFTVASDANIHRDMIAARDRAIAALDGHPIQFSITADDPVGDGSVIAPQARAARSTRRCS